MGRPRLQQLEQRSGRSEISTFDGGLGIAAHSGEPRDIKWEFEACRCEGLENAPSLGGSVAFDVSHGESPAKRREAREVDRGLLDEWSEFSHRPPLGGN